jgi:prepilin-type N-terminal cleavage/methylation domain-containing protein
MKGWFIFDRVCANIVTRSSLRGAGGSGRLTSKAMKTHPVKSRKISGFSLVEVLAVMAVVAVMMSLLVPAIQGFSDTAGRRGAVSTVMNTLEQARVAALESGSDVFVVICRQATPNEDRMMVLRETETGIGKYDQLTKWVKLPKGIIFFDPTSGPASILDAGVGGFDRSRSPVAIPEDSTLPTNKGLVAVKFNGSGQVAFPTTGKLWLHISEGVRDMSGAEARVDGKVANALPFEIITMAKYTGRAQLDVTQLASN